MNRTGFIGKNKKRSRIGLILATLVFFIIFEAAIFYKLVLFFKIDHSWIILFYIILTSLFLYTRPLIALFYKDDHEHDDEFMRSYPSVTCIIAAKNEEDAIYRAIKSCLSSDYPSTIECIVINDGSTDNTLAEMQRAKKELSDPTKNREVAVISFEKNLGKREAMAVGIKQAKGDITVFVDSDSFLNHDAMRTIVAHFHKDQKIAGVSGNTKVENSSTNTLTKMQAARYGISFDVFKSCEGVFNSVNCCPGCFSAYRTSVIKSLVGDWKGEKIFGIPGTFGDDRSLTNHVMKAGYNVTYCRTACATTIVPEKYSVYKRQQLRWKKSWIREGVFSASKFMWRRNIGASLSFYINLILPIIAPLVVLYSFVWNIVIGRFDLAALFIVSIILTSTVFGLYDYIQSHNRYWYYAIPFGILYTFVLMWQMPVAIVKFTDGRWGTR